MHYDIQILKVLLLTVLKEGFVLAIMFRKGLPKREKEKTGNVLVPKRTPSMSFDR
jgi:hypothetical protein